MSNLNEFAASFGDRAAEFFVYFPDADKGDFMRSLKAEIAAMQPWARIPALAIVAENESQGKCEAEYPGTDWWSGLSTSTHLFALESDVSLSFNPDLPGLVVLQWSEESQEVNAKDYAVRNAISAILNGTI